MIESVRVLINSAACTRMCINSEERTGYQAQYFDYTDWMNSRRCRWNILPHIWLDHIQNIPVCPRSDPTTGFYTPFLLHIWKGTQSQRLYSLGSGAKNLDRLTFNQSLTNPLYILHVVPFVIVRLISKVWRPQDQHRIMRINILLTERILLKILCE